MGSTLEGVIPDVSEKVASQGLYKCSVAVERDINASGASRTQTGRHGKATLINGDN